MISKTNTHKCLFFTQTVNFFPTCKKDLAENGSTFWRVKKSHMKENPKLIISLKRKCSLKRAVSHYNMTQVIFTLVSARSRRHKSDLTKHFLFVHSNAKRCSPSFLIGSFVLHVFGRRFWSRWLVDQSSSIACQKPSGKNSNAKPRDGVDPHARRRALIDTPRPSTSRSPNYSRHQQTTAQPS